MKARVKATGDIVEVNQCYILYDDGRRELIYGKELEEVQGAPDYWTRLEHQYAGMAMQGLMSYVGQIAPKKGRSFCDEIVGISFTVAHALVEKYKKEERK